MRLFDITLPVSQGLPVWPGDPSVAVEPSARIANGAKANLSRIDMGSHTGTHIDAPFHFNDNGLTVDRLPLELLIGRVSVIEIGEEKRAIDKALLESIGISNIDRVLFKTGNSRRYSHEFVMDFTALTPDGAEFLVKKGVKVVGIDYLSIERYGSKDHRVHHLLLDSGVIIIEGLYLKDVKPGDYELIALPLKLKGGDGAPARVVIMEVSR